jgi:hypothetical protein
MALVVLQGKVLPEVFDNFKRAQENSGAETFNQFMEMMLEAYLNPKTKTIEVVKPTEEQAREIQLKDNEIGRIKTQLSLSADQLAARDEQVRSLQAQVDELVNRGPVREFVQPELGENQVLIDLPPIVALVIDREAAIARKKSGKEFSRGDILLNNFWESIENGQSYPFKVWTRSELVELKKQLQNRDV